MSARAMVGIAAIAIVAAAARVDSGTMDEGMCAPPPVDTAKWKLMQTNGISMKVPPGFSQIYREENYLVFATGAKAIVIAHGEGPDQVSSDGGLTVLSTCTAMIAGRPASIQVQHFMVVDPPFKFPSGNAGAKFVALARWRASNGLPTVTAWIYSNNRNDLHDLKGVFYTADVGVKAPKPCVDQTPLPAPDSVLDSAAIAMAVASQPAPWPSGNAVIQMKWDSAGALSAIGVIGGDLSDSTKRHVAMVLGTNARERALGATSVVQLRVTSKSDGVSYTIEKAVICPQ